MADDDLSKTLEDLGITEDDIYKEAGSDIESGLNSMADDVLSYWASHSPQDTGEYKRDLKISTMEDENGRPVRRVGDYAEYAHIIEYGSEDTDEHMIRAKTAARFGNEGKYLI